MTMTGGTFDERFDALSAIAYRVAYRLLGDRGEAEEVAQEALARAYARWRKVADYDKPWVARVALNLALGRTRRRRPQFSFDESIDVPPAGGDEACRSSACDLALRGPPTVDTHSRGGSPRNPSAIASRTTWTVGTARFAHAAWLPTTPSTPYAGGFYARAMAFDEGLAERIRSLSATALGMAERKMFGGLAFMIDGNMAYGVIGSELIVRVGPDAFDDALAQPHARVMDFTGRPSRGMVYVADSGIAEDADLVAWLDRGLAFAGSLPPK